MRPLLPVALALAGCPGDGAPTGVTRLAGFTEAAGLDCPPRAARADQPTKAEWAEVKAALERAPAADGAFEVVLAGSGCARLVERRAQGEVRRWELWRKQGSRWALNVAWDFAPGVKRPTSVPRRALLGTVEGGGELDSPELERKHVEGEVWTRARLRAPCPDGLTHCPGHGLKSFEDDLD